MTRAEALARLRVQIDAGSPIIGEKLNAACGPTVLFMPLRGVSAIATEGQVFHDADADRALFDCAPIRVGQWTRHRRRISDKQRLITATTSEFHTLQVLQALRDVTPRIGAFVLDVVKQCACFHRRAKHGRPVDLSCP